MKAVGLALVVSLASAGPVVAQTPAAQNNRVTVWDVAPGAPQPATSPSRDVVMFVIRGDASNAQGTAVFRAKGAPPSPVPADARTVVIELQDAAVPPLANDSGHPLAFPRSGVTKLLENDRVVVWSASWTLGEVTPMHFHDKDAVAFFLADGTLGGTDAQGQTGSTEHHFGLIRLAARGRQHTELLVRGQGRALIVELK